MRSPTENIDYTSRDYEAFRETLIEKLQEKMPEYTDTTETDAGIVIIEALANGLDILSLYTDIIANDIVLPTTQSRKMAVLLAKCLGYTPYNQTASEYPQVFVLTSKRSVDTLIPKGTVVKTTSDNDLATLYFETIEDFIIPANCLGNEKEGDNYLYTTTVVAGQSISQDILGTSSGAPLQSFTAKYKNVIVDSLKVYVDEGGGKQLWEKVDTFFDSDENSKVYMVSVDDFDQCTVQFGNGLKGKIPNAYPNGISANYRVGGGEASNVSANIITAMETGLAYVKSTFNLEATVRGHDKESLESIKVNAPASYRARDRFVTLEDYEDLLRIKYYDILDVRAVRDTINLRHVHLYYIMRSGYTMTQALTNSISEYVGSRSMIGCTYDLSSYVAQTVNIQAKLYVDQNFDAEDLVEDIENYLTNVTFHYGELVFGDSIVKSDLETEIKNMFEGILSFRINTPNTDIISPTLPQNILVLGTISITTEYI